MAQHGEPSTLEAMRTWARRTTAAGLAGAAFGGMKAWVTEQPVSFLASSYGLNSLLFAGSLFGARSVILTLLERTGAAGVGMDTLVQQRRALIASSLSGFIVGGAVTSVVCKLRLWVTGNVKY
jgi:hypothetical protein